MYLTVATKQDIEKAGVDIKQVQFYNSEEIVLARQLSKGELKVAEGKPAQDSAIELINISPPISSKIRKVRSAGRTFDWNKKEIAEKGLSLDNPAAMAIGQLVSATTNVPLDRGIKKLTNIKDALDSENEEWIRIATVLGWSKWELEWKKDKKKKRKVKSKLSNRSSLGGPSKL